MKAIIHMMATKGSEWIKEHPHGSYAPVRQNTVTQWWVYSQEESTDHMKAVMDSIARALYLHADGPGSNDQSPYSVTGVYP